tara:strand:+ start:886 stop:1287 length:402 start_codon:yes stop_codon:yes gene_type:complete
MTSAVLIDDAWASCSHPVADTPEAWGSQAEANLDSHRATDAETQQARAAKRVVVTNESPPRQARHRTEDERAIQKLCRELSSVRQRLDDRDQTQAVVLYGALVVVIVLMALLLRTTSKLDHLAECMMWMHARR